MMVSFNAIGWTEGFYRKIMLGVCPVVEVDIGSSLNPGFRNDVVMGEWSLLFPLVRLISLPIIATISLPINGSPIFGVTVAKEKRSYY